MNVAIVTVDCLRSDRVGFMGYDGETTPFLDKLAAEGTIFENAFATGSATTYSMPGLMTGTYPSWFGGYPPIPESVTTLAEAFRTAGFTTVGVHSNPWLHPTNQFDTGFDVYVDLTKRQLAGKATSPNLERSLTDQLIDSLKSIYHELPDSLQRIVSQSYYMYYYHFDRAHDRAEIIVDRTIKTLNEHEVEDVFLWVHFMDVHRPYTLPSDSLEGNIWRTARITRPEYTQPTTADQAYISKIYDSSIKYVDEQIERLYRYFEQEGANDETLFVITSDHGEEFGEHGDWFHKNFKLYNELLNVPLVISHPSVKSRRFDGLVSLIDVALTVLEYVEADVPGSMSGRSLVPVLHGDSVPGRDVVFSEIYDPHRNKFAVQSNHWKYITNRMQGRKELYDLDADPREQRNIFPEQEIPQEIRSEARRYSERMKRPNEIELNTGVEAQLKELGYLE